MRICALLFLYFLPISLWADIKLPALIGDGMVLQRDQTLQIWGHADANEKVKLTFRKFSYKTKADSHGYFEFVLPAQTFGGPFEMLFEGKNKILIKDILVGDVWLCSGQSNMVINMERVKEKYPDDIATADYPQIRNYFVPTQNNLNSAQQDFETGGKWSVASPESVMHFGAVSFFFAREIYNKYKVPIGIINASVGGTPIEAWMSETAFPASGEWFDKIQRNKDTSYIQSQRIRNASINVSVRPQDQGLIESQEWYKPDYQALDWAAIHVPGYWEDQGLKDLNGIVWYRKEIELNESICLQESKLFLGRIVDADHVYVNGREIGNITYQYPPRRYTIPKGVLKPGKNVITVRVQNFSGKGGFVPDKKYSLECREHVIDLSGAWMYKVGEVFPAETKKQFLFEFQKQPSALYNAMLAPIVAQTAIKGMIWYQGESNVSAPEDYKSHLTAFISDIRVKFKSSELPFFVIQLAGFQDRTLLPAESNLARIRFAQFQASRELRYVTSIVTADLGEWNDIHPLNKKDIGLRTALAARNMVYGEDSLSWSGPQFNSCFADGNKMLLKFDHIGKGLVSNDDKPLSYFELAGIDGKFKSADAWILNNQVELKADGIAKPHFVRYAWADNPVGANLSNETGIPAASFECAIAENDLVWRGRKAAIVLTYDDALDSHLDIVIPQLDSAGFKATFYVPVQFMQNQNRVEEWKEAAKSGHELGNHTVYHPCDASKAGRDWVSPDNDLSKYSVSQISREIKTANQYLALLDHQQKRTFAYSCGDTDAGDGSFVSDISSNFAALRGVQSKLNFASNINYQNINAYAISEQNENEMTSLVREAIQQNALLVFIFHGIGGDHSINVNVQAHTELIQFLKKHESEIWIGTMQDVAQHLKSIKK